MCGCSELATTSTGCCAELAVGPGCGFFEGTRLTGTAGTDTLAALAAANKDALLLEDTGGVETEVELERSAADVECLIGSGLRNNANDVGCVFSFVVAGAAAVLGLLPAGACGGGGGAVADMRCLGPTCTDVEETRSLPDDEVFAAEVLAA